MKRMGIVANLSKPHAANVLQRLGKYAARHGIDLVVTDESSRWLPRAKRVSPSRLAQSIDLLVVLGGDGTLLHAVKGLRGSQVPLLGINLGSLGFLTSVTEPEMEAALDAVREGRCRESLRTVAHAQLIRGRRRVADYCALNDVVIGWGESSRVLRLDLRIDEETVAHYVCDGLIVSTPTGSTGHSLSGGGPILHPEAPVFVVNPICPHTLSHRPMVVPDVARIEILIAKSDKRPLLAIDGQDHHRLQEGDRIRIRRDSWQVRLLNPPSYSYFDLLRRKLHLRGSAV